MKITTNLNAFKDIIKEVSKIKFNKDAIECNKSLLIEANKEDVVVSINTLDCYYSRKLDSYIIEPGQVVIPLKTLKLISKIKNNCQVTITEKEIVAGTKKATYENLYSNYIKIKNEEFKNIFTINENELHKMLEVSYAAATDEARPILQGINIKNNKFCAIDGFRVSIRESNQFNIENDVTLSYDLWNNILKLINKKSENQIQVSLNEKESKIKFDFKDFVICGSLLEGGFIKYESIIPSESKMKCKIKDNNKMLESLEFISEFISKEKRLPMILTTDFENQILKIKSSTKENTISDTVEVEFIEKENEINTGFNVKYLISAIKINKNRELTFRGISNVNPFMFSHEDGLELVLPVRMA